MLLAIDVGYSDVKALIGLNGSGYATARRVKNPSVVGTPNAARFALGDTESQIITVNGEPWYYGETAIKLSRFTSKPEDRSWYTSDAYKVLVAAIMAGATDAKAASFDLATGLPLSYYGDRFDWRDSIAGTYTIKLGDRDAQSLTINPDPVVVGQPFGSLLSVALDNDGVLHDDRFVGKVAVLDIGSKTTNVLACDGLEEVAKNSKSIPVGGWDLVRAVGEYLDTRCPDRDLEPHEIAQAVINKSIWYGPEQIDLTEQIMTYAGELAREVVSLATQYLGAAKDYQVILVTGGGSYLLGEEIKAHYNFAEIIPDPVFGNAQGYYKLLVRGSSK